MGPSIPLKTSSPRLFILASNTSLLGLSAGSPNPTLKRPFVKRNKTLIKFRCFKRLLWYIQLLTPTFTVASLRINRISDVIGTLCPGYFNFCRRLEVIMDV
ncbi:uncharacterized protein BDW43DRAFT_133599 [Aspergillus alliaceus]|uniref:uncharacterized protein n=1 Tax=Petromyces alliaceus TaxID=209559 RepID=UPI0012A73E4C|nr:uncharacterized protein BDW43DRAFT_133599 [Aspergillus alliaceus]KAB8231803.1 hypothetical protein BDW43DRAFT_133599 [Aspergillus alliaceus]